MLFETKLVFKFKPRILIRIRSWNETATGLQLKLDFACLDRF
jgi:hypothetical protein